MNPISVGVKEHAPRGRARIARDKQCRALVESPLGQLEITTQQIARGGDQPGALLEPPLAVEAGY